jgi:uncharacterized protein YecA (UPF0149 family)
MGHILVQKMLQLARFDWSIEMEEEQRLASRLVKLQLANGVCDHVVSIALEIQCSKSE